MTALPESEPSSSAYAAVRERCRRLGLPTWRFDTGGALVEEPIEPGLAGLWLRSSEVNRLITRAFASCDDPSAPEDLVSVFPGCWLAPLPETRRGRGTGMTLAMALSEAALASDLFESACKSAQLEPFACRAALKRFARFDDASARACASMLRWMARDLSALAEYQDAVSGFTNELTQAYETISLLYSLGQEMRDLDQPGRFVAIVCDRIQETMPYAWLTAEFLPDDRLCGPLAGRRVIRGTPRLSAAETSSLIDGLSSRPESQRGPTLVNPDGRRDSASQVLVQPITRGGRLAGALLTGDKFGEDPQLSSYDMQLLEAAAAYIGAFIDNAGLFADQQRTMLGSLKALTASIDAKDRYTRGHSERVAHVAAMLARAAGFDDRQTDRVHICGLLHDVGKIGVPEGVLTKPGRLTDDEFAQIKQHPEIGYRILKDIPQLEDILPGVLHHHERWDGQGYPHAIRGENIPMIARLIGLADTFDAMSSTRSYRAAMPRERVLAEIQRCSGTQFDPALAKVFATIDLTSYDAMAARHAADHGAPAEGSGASSSGSDLPERAAA